jgi:hypothetical protein
VHCLLLYCSLSAAAQYCPAAARFCDGSSYKACGSDGICLCKDGAVADPAAGRAGELGIDPICVDAALQCPATASGPPKICDSTIFLSCSSARECVCSAGQENLNGRCICTYILHTSAHTNTTLPRCSQVHVHVISSHIGCRSAVCSLRFADTSDRCGNGICFGSCVDDDCTCSGGQIPFADA